MARGKLEFCKEIPKQSTEANSTTRCDDLASKTTMFKSTQLTSSKRARDKQTDVQGTVTGPLCQIKRLKKWIGVLVTY